MRKQREIAAARARLNERLRESANLTSEQKANLCGILTALVWCAGDHSDTMDRLLSNEPLAAGKPSGPAIARLDEGIRRARQQEEN